MTARFKAEGIRSLGHGSGSFFHLGSEITEGLSTAIGRNIDFEIRQSDMAWLLTYLAHRFPDAFREIAAILGDYQPEGPGRYDFKRHERETRLIEAITAAIKNQGTR